MLEAVRKLYRPENVTLSLAEQAELMRRFIEHWERLKDLPELQELYRDISGYLDEIKALGISDSELRGALSWWEKALRLAQHAFFLVVMVPLAVPGFFIHLPVLIAAIATARTLTSRGDVRATIQMCVVTALTFVAYAGAAYAAYRGADSASAGLAAAASTLGLLILSGAATLRVLDGQGELRRGVWTFLTLLHLDRELLQMRTRRDALRARLLHIVDKYADKDLERIVPREVHGDAPEAWLDDEESAV